mmetsp:Transcript_619/g.1814  ORF Transcript_619/g.1814 Transcript_619/m.1814 type:complete len:221 (-) Transcript_619:1785-2447(-)
MAHGMPERKSQRHPLVALYISLGLLQTHIAVSTTNDRCGHCLTSLIGCKRASDRTQTPPDPRLAGKRCGAKTIPTVRDLRVTELMMTASLCKQRSNAISHLPSANNEVIAITTVNGESVIRTVTGPNANSTDLDCSTLGSLVILHAPHAAATMLSTASYGRFARLVLTRVRLVIPHALPRIRLYGIFMPVDNRYSVIMRAVAIDTLTSMAATPVRTSTSK